MRVPFNDLSRAHGLIRKELGKAFSRALDRSRFILDRETKAFESNFAAYLGVKHCIGCGNATDALEIILRALGIGNGDEVLVPALTYMATAEAVLNAGAIPRFIDIEKEYRTISPAELEKSISTQTKAIIVVHLYGWPADMDAIVGIAGRHNLFIIEDCAQAHGAEYMGKKAGTFGDAAAFSFYPTKNLGALGDGGIIATNQDDVAAICRMMANHGQAVRDDFRTRGRNSRLDEIQAAFLNVKLKHLDFWNSERERLSLRYFDNLKGSELILPLVPKHGRPVYHLFVVVSPNRDLLQSGLLKNDIQTLVHYRKVLPDLPPFQGFGNDCPVARQLADQVISLPLFPGMTLEEVDFVCEKILEVLE